jgi:hypothetical protein
LGVVKGYLMLTDAISEGFAIELARETEDEERGVEKKEVGR